MFLPTKPPLIQSFTLMLTHIYPYRLRCRQASVSFLSEISSESEFITFKYDCQQSAALTFSFLLHTIKHSNIFRKDTKYALL